MCIRMATVAERYGQNSAKNAQRSSYLERGYSAKATEGGGCCYSSRTGQVMLGESTRGDDIMIIDEEI